MFQLARDHCDSLHYGFWQLRIDKNYDRGSHFLRLDDEAKVTAIEEIHDDVVEEAIDDYIKEIATQEMLLVHQLNKYMTVCPQIAEDLINELIGS